MQHDNTPELGNARTVFVVQTVQKDFSDARRYGNLRSVFGSPRRPYNTEALINRARKVLELYQPGDYLLMVGDPALCGVAMSVVCEKDDNVNVLSWDNNTLSYRVNRWNFGDNDYAVFEDDEFAED